MAAREIGVTTQAITDWSVGRRTPAAEQIPKLWFRSSLETGYKPRPSILGVVRPKRQKGSMKFDHDQFISLYESQYGTLNSSQASGLGGLLAFVERDNHVNDVRWAAYMLATVKHECANRWQPLEEFGRGQGKVYGNPVTVTVSEGKTYTNTYYGRGFVQLR